MADKLQTRNSNIELLRLVLMVMVILLHFNNDTMGGAFVISKNLPQTDFILHFLESLSICAVNCFMIVSGYFLFGNKKIKFGKIADILLIVIFYRFVNWFVKILLLHEAINTNALFTLWLPANYFAIFYCICYFFSPFISKFYEICEKRNALILTGSLLVIFVLLPTVFDIGTDVTGVSFKNISPISTLGNGGGYTVVQFFVDLCIGMCIRKFCFDTDWKKLFVVYIVASLFMTIFVKRLPSLYNYCSVLTVLTAVCVFMLFRKLNFQSRAVNYISKSVFAIFCIHTSGFANTLWTKYFITQEHFQGGTLQNLVWTLLSVFAMFFFSLLLSITMRLIFGKLKIVLCSKLPVIELF